MAASKGVSRAHVVLEAIRLAINADIPALHQLTAQRPDVLKLETTLQILLTYLPESTEPRRYIDFLHDLSRGLLTAYHSDSYDNALGSSHTAPEQDISDGEALIRVKRLRLASLKEPHSYYDQDSDPLTVFLLRQAHRIDAETGSLDLVHQLVEPFIEHSESLRAWAISYLLPLLRLDYEYYPHSGPSHSLAHFEKLDNGLAVQSLLSKGVQKKDPGDTQEIGRDLRGLIGPWMYGESARKRRRLNSRSRRKSSISAVTASAEATGNGQAGSDWSHVNEWLLDLSSREFQKSVDVLQKWTGPGDVDYGDWDTDTQPLNEERLRPATRAYAQAGLGAAYSTNECSKEAITGSHRILLNVARLVDIGEPPELTRTGDAITSGISREFLNGLSPTHLLHHALLRPANPLTTPTKSSIMLFNLFLYSSYKLYYLGNRKSCKSLAELSLFASEDEQRAELRKTLYTLKSDLSIENTKWPRIRHQLLWLRHWERQQGTEDEPRGIFGRIARAELEGEFLRAILDRGLHRVAEDIYIKENDSPLPVGTVEKIVLSAALSSYDAASDCRRVEGSALQASYDTIEAFRKYFPNSKQFAQTTALLSATDAISHYQLTLLHGTPLRPVNIRANKDPVWPIGRILNEGHVNYTKLDDLLGIGNKLVAAGLAHQSLEPSFEQSTEEDAEQQSVNKRRITQMAIETALEHDNFETAYSYVTTRLPSAEDSMPKSSATSSKPLPRDDISWRAAYQAGRYHINATTTLLDMEKRLEMLSQALLLAPSSALSEILVAWQQCEQEMTARTAREAEEEQNWDERGSRKVPGGFSADSTPVIQKARDPSRNALVEEAPMGLFDVARGAAAALSKNAFPLRGVPKGEAPPSKTSQGRPLSTASLGSSDEGDISGAGGQGRVRKRDMVSSMVTGGLASGIGWVIGESGKVRRG